MTHPQVSKLIPPHLKMSSRFERGQQTFILEPKLSFSESLKHRRTWTVPHHATVTFDLNTRQVTSLLFTRTQWLYV